MQRQDRCVARRVHVQADDILDLRGERRIAGALEDSQADISVRAATVLLRESDQAREEAERLTRLAERLRAEAGR